MDVCCKLACPPRSNNHGSSMIKMHGTIPFQYEWKCSTYVILSIASTLTFISVQALPWVLFADRVSPTGSSSGAQPTCEGLRIAELDHARRTTPWEATAFTRLLRTCTRHSPSRRSVTRLGRCAVTCLPTPGAVRRCIPPLRAGRVR